jgi:acyl-CoA synthetase (AMP-forming)/AMP-acid ligase II/thioesterase domain-containing protein/acyl carrier protein
MLRQLIRDRAQRCREAPAILAPGYGALDYEGLLSVVDRVGAALARFGIEPADRIALVCSNGPQAATAFLGIAAHAACAPLNPGYQAAEFEFYLTDLGTRALVAEAGLDSAARPVAAALNIPVFELTARPSSLAGDIDLSGLGLTGSKRECVPAPDDVALLLHTSGTTSRPKLVPLTQANLTASARHIAESLALTEHDRCLNVMPLFHVHGLEAALLATMASGGSVVCCPGFVAPKFFDWVTEFAPTWYTAVPTIHQSVLARAKLQNLPGTRLRFIRSCSSALAPSLMEELEAAFRVPVIEAYGMTEAAHQMASNPLPPGKRKPGSVGVAAGPEVAIMDDSGRLLPPEAGGEIVIRGPNVTPGYVGNSEANSAAYREGWFRTGDQGYIDGDGYLFLSGRLKEIINRGGEKIAPREVDEALLTHPAVSQAVAFSVPHSTLGETVAAAVVLRPGCVATEKDLREFAAERLALFKVPERILFLDEIPKGPTGKIQRIGLAARLGVGEISPVASSGATFVAPRSRMEKQIAAIVADTLGAQRVGMTDSVFDLGADSLLVAMLLARIKESEGTEISFLQFAEEPTVAGLCRQAGTRPAQPAHDKLRVVVRPGNDGPALFCVPGSTGNVAVFFQLARRLGQGQAVTAFRMPSWDSGYRLEELAARYVADVMEAQPQGPYYLVGFCTGGFVAYEMARQIREKGGEVGVLALFDCYNHAWTGGRSWFRRLACRFDLLRQRFRYQRRNIAKRGVRGAIRYLRPKFVALLETTRNRSVERTYRLIAGAGVKSHDPRLAIRLAASRYVPLVWSGKLDLFRVDEPHVDAYPHSEMGWTGLAEGGIEVHDITGNHMTIFSEPQVQVVAEGLLELLSRVPVESLRNGAT